MPDKYQRDVQKKIKAIIADGIGATQRKIDPLLEQYIGVFYLHAPLEFLQSFSTAHLYIAAVENWKFISKRDNASEPRKVRVFNPTIETNGWVSSRTIVELNTKDSPFILDSISAELTQRGYRIYEVMHPVLRLRRNKDGNIVEFFDKDNEKQSLESAMHFQISYIPDEDEVKDLESDIENTLHFVNMAVADWGIMAQKTKEIMADLDSDNIPYDRDYVNEVQDFLQWNIDRNFLFLGYRKYTFDQKGRTPKVSYNADEDLGIFGVQYDDEIHEAKPLGIEALPKSSIKDTVQDRTLMEITKSSRKSVVHRPVHMDYIGIKIFDEKSQVVGEHRLLGLFTSAVYYQSAMTIPIIRRKIDAVVRRSGFPADSHSGKALVTVLESYPRDELLQVSEADLYSVGMGIVELLERPTTKFFARNDRFNRFVSCIIFVPRDRFNTTARFKIQDVLEREYNGTITDHYLQVTESPLARIHMLIKIDKDNITIPNLEDIERQLIEVTTSWSNGLRESLIRNLGEREGEKLFLRYVDAFPDSFKDSYHFGGTFCDIMKMEEAARNSDMTLDLYQLLEDDDGAYQLKFYNKETQVTLSNVMPILENMGFHAVDELTFFIKPRGLEEGIWVHHFRLRVSRTLLLKQSDHGLAQFKDEFEDALLNIWHGNIEDDALNKLILRAGMKWRDIMMLRAYSKYIVQTDCPYSHEYLASAIARYPVITGCIIDLFRARFNPVVAKKKRDEVVESAYQAIMAELGNVSNVAEDKVLRQFTDTIMATLRTNFYQLDADKKPKNYISLKFDSAKVPNLPLPRPHTEIFVYSCDVEGVHLRGGKVARGGLRWSDRHEDFRTEVLGLVKAQQVKNSVIVPVGSKGGFVVKNPVVGSRDEVVAQGQECYKTYLSGLLDITDNIVDGKVVPPILVIRHDDDDPYLVVAADKGTATFSDIANAVSEKYGFWLGDAFASGGSVGYDHKKMGITARGAWVSVQRHFMEMGVDCQTEDFTCIGIGDMAGDVFGNGMLLSQHNKLVGAFNHMHIFLDPNPTDVLKSWKERKRLFEMPRSSWMDYDQKLISEGGAIFERSAKKVTLTKEIKALLDIDKDKISPDALISAMLKARVDLLWNGGIGTYVKAEIESTESVGDKANDNLRINGNELRCKVIGEGGNLGLTQLARIEYGAKGGRVNTDAIDNSAGVDCSDHEVNIKIALNKAVENGKMTEVKRNNLLARMTDEVGALVLRDNALQTQAITIAQMQGHMILEQKARMMEAFEERGFLDRKIEFLPDAETLVLRQSAKIGLTRPEIAVLLAYAKMDIYEDLLSSSLPDDKYQAETVVSYFPKEMQKAYADELKSHQLRREIVTTVVANDIVNRMGSTFYHRMKENTGLKGCDVARAYIVTRDAYRLPEIWDEIEALGSSVDVGVQTEMFLKTRRLIERASSWFLRNSSHPLSACTLVEDFAEGIQELSANFDEIVSPALKEARDVRKADYLKHNVPEELASKVANLVGLTSASDIVQVYRGNKKASLVEIGKVYYNVGSRLGFTWLRSGANQLLSHSHWENLAVQTFTETFFDQQMQVTDSVVSAAKAGTDAKSAVEDWCEDNAKNLSRYDLFISDLRRQEVIDHSMLTVAIQRGEGLFSL